MPEIKLKNQNLLHNFKCSLKSLETKLAVMDKLNDYAQKFNLNVASRNDESSFNIKEHIKKVTISFR